MGGVNHDPASNSSGWRLRPRGARSARIELTMPCTCAAFNAMDQR